MKHSKILRKSTWKMDGEFLLFSSKIAGIDTSAQQFEHFFHKIDKNHVCLLQEHRHLVLEVNNNWKNVLVVWKDGGKFSERYQTIDTHLDLSEPTKTKRSVIFVGRTILNTLTIVLKNVGDWNKIFTNKSGFNSHASNWFYRTNDYQIGVYWY